MTRPLEVLVLESAAADLIDIYRYVEVQSGSPRIARLYLEKIEEVLRTIGLAPRAGRARDDLLPGLRLHAWKRTIVVAYRVTDTAVEIVNVFYGGRDYEAIYQQDQSCAGDD